MTGKNLLAVLVSLALVAPVQAQKIVIGSKAFTESVILAEILAALARDAGAEVEVKAELGGTQLVWHSLKSGQIDTYVEYTGTLTSGIFVGEGIGNNDEMALRAAVEKLGLRLSNPLGFDNTYALGMLESVAQKKGISSIPDLQKHAAGMRFVFSEEFALRADGWPGLKAAYRLEPGKSRNLAHDFVYRALADGQADVCDIYTTDAEVKQLGLRVLEDNKLYFPSYKAVILTRADLESRAPKVAAAWRRLEGAIDTPAMTAMNARVQIDKHTEARTAVEFLNEKFDLSLPLPVEESNWVRVGRSILLRGAEHLFLVAVSLSLAILVAIPLGIVSYKLPKVGYGIIGVVSVIQTIPSLALLVFLLPLFSLGAGTAIAALFLYSLLPIVRNTYTGLQSIPPALIEASHVLGMPWYARMWRIELPLASPSILAGIKIAAVLNVGTATIGALIGAGGYGQPILTGIRLYDMGQILQGAIPAAVLALAVQGLFSLAEKGLVPRGLRLEMAR